VLPIFFHTVLTQWVKFRTFLSHRVNVKSIFDNIKVEKNAFFAILRALKCVNLGNFNLQKVKNP